MLTKRLAAFICAFALAGACVTALPEDSFFPTADAAGAVTKTEGASSDNRLTVSNSNWADTVKSYIYESSNNTVTRVEYIASKVIVENYDMTSGKLLSSRELKMELPIFGGFYVGENYNFLVTGQTNTEENNDKAIIAVTRFAKDFKSSQTKILNGRNTTVPFDAGSCRMTEAQGKLYIHTCHEMYTSSDGYNHQANMSYVLNIETMKFEQEHYKVSWPDYTGKIGDAFGYSSHSFNQFILSDDEAVYALDHGDAYPRALRLHKYTLSDGYLSYNDLVTIPGTVGANYTGVTVGDMELSKNNVLIGVKMPDFSGGTVDKSSDRKDINIIVMPKSKVGTDTAPTIVKLTNYNSSNNTYSYNSAPIMVKVNDNKFVVMWKESNGYSSSYNWNTGEWTTTEKDGVTKIATIDANGKLIGSILESADIALSDCDPILCSDGMVRWYAASGAAPVIYALDPNDPATFTSGSHVPGDVNNDGKANIKDVMLIQQYIVGWKVDVNKTYADVNGDGNVNIRDVMLLQQSIAGWKVTIK